LRLLAPAKVNLYLEVLSKFADGYHDVRTIYQSIDLYDELEFELERTSSSSHNQILLEIEPEGVLPKGSDNLIYQAAERFFDLAALKDRFQLTVKLIKKIPIAAGLAGGSTDAACVLRALCRLLPEAALSQTDIEGIAQSLGADVSFCLKGGTALGQGRGDDLQSLASCPELYFLLILPADKLSAREVYERFDEIYERSDQQDKSSPSQQTAYDIQFEQMLQALQAKDSAQIIKSSYNSLENAATSLSPWLATLRRYLNTLNIKSLVSGSGPTALLISAELSEIETLQQKLNQNYQSIICQPVSAAT